MGMLNSSHIHSSIRTWCARHRSWCIVNAHEGLLILWFLACSFVGCIFSLSKYTEWFLNLICNKQKSPSKCGNVSFLRDLYSNVVLKQILPGSISIEMEPSSLCSKLVLPGGVWGSLGVWETAGWNIYTAVCGVPVQSSTESFSFHLVSLTGTQLTWKRKRERE